MGVTTVEKKLRGCTRAELETALGEMLTVMRGKTRGTPNDQEVIKVHAPKVVNFLASREGPKVSLLHNEHVWSYETLPDGEDEDEDEDAPNTTVAGHRAISVLNMTYGQMLKHLAAEYIPLADKAQELSDEEFQAWQDTPESDYVDWLAMSMGTLMSTIPETEGEYPVGAVDLGDGRAVCRAVQNPMFADITHTVTLDGEFADAV